MGCTGSYRKKLQTIDSKVTHQELIDSWLDYNISYHERSYFGITVIVFDPKNDDKKILVGSHWKTVIDQKTWTEFANANTTSDGNFKLPRGKITPTQTSETTGVLELWGLNNQQYGFFIRQERMDFVCKAGRWKYIAGTLVGSYPRIASKIDLSSNPDISKTHNF